jgi:hypothetical protein
MTIAIALHRDKETKNTIRYREPEGDQVIYVAKDRVQQLGNPEHITLEITTA